MQTQPTEMTTLTAVLNKLQQKGFNNEFEITAKGFAPGNGRYYQPEDLTIIKTYRFEGDSDPADSSIVYVIQTNDGLTGFCLDAYGTYSTHEEGKEFDEFIKKIPVEERDEQAIFSE